MVRDGRILQWGLADKVDGLIADGVTQDRAIAEMLRSDPYAASLTGKEKVLTSDVTKYKQSIARKQDEARAKSLAYSREGREVIELAREGTLYLLEQVDSLKPTLKNFIASLATVEEQYRASLDTDDPMPVPTQHIDAIERLIRILKGLFDSVSGDTRLQQLVKSQTINFNQGISEEKLFDTLAVMARYLKCVSCNRCFEPNDVSAAFARAQRELRERDRVIDTQVPLE